MDRCCTANSINSPGNECNDESVSLFKVPNESDMLDKWLQALGPAASFLYKNSVICERHFHEDQIKREALLRDSFGNAILQRPFIKLSLVKEAVPSIFHKDTEVNPMPGRKRKTSPLRQQKHLNTAVESNASVNYSNIVVSFHENQTSSVQYVPNGSQALSTSATSVGPITNYETSGAQAVFNKNNINAESLPENGHVQIYTSPQGFDANAVNNLENYRDSFLVNKQQVFQRIPNLNGSSVQLPKEVAAIVPDDEVTYLNQINNNNCPQQKKITAVKRSKKRSVQYPLQQSEKDMSLRSFDLIYQNSDKIKLPNSMWGYHKNDRDNNIMVFSKVRWFSTNACTLPLYERQVVFHESNELKIFINNVFSPLETPRPRDISEMEQVLSDVDKLTLCSGGPSIEFAPVAALAQKDHAVGRWRHKYCPILVASTENACKYCSSINQVFRYPKQKRLPFGKRPRAQKQQVKNSS